MADYTAKWRIQGENGMQAAFRSILGDAKSTSDKMGRLFKTAFAGISAVGIAVGLKNAAAEAIRYGDEMQKASARTKLGAAEFAEIAGAAKLFDVELGTLSKGLRTMQTRLSEAATGAKAPAETFAALGIEVKEFRKLKADEQLEVLADQLVKLKDPTDRARAGTDLFGRAWDELAPFLLKGAEGLREARKEIRALGGALTDEEIARLADADEAIKRLDASWSGLARTLTAKAAPALAGFFDILRRGFGGGTELERLREELTELNRLIEGMSPEVQSKPINQNIIQRRRIVEAELAALGEFESKGPSRRRSFPGAGPVAPGFEPAPPKDKKPKGSGLEEMNVWARPIFNLANEQADAIKVLNAETVRDTDRMAIQIQNTYHEMSLDMQEQWREAAEAQTAWTAMADEAARNMQTAFADFLFDPFAEGLKGMAAGFVDMIRRMVAEVAAQQLLMSFFTWGAGLGGGIGSFFSAGLKSITPAPKALGGPVMGGTPYLVGEKGPELFVPGASGSIVPNSKLAASGGVTINQYTTINSQGDDTRLRAALPGLLKQTKDQAVAEVRSLVGRGRLT